MTGTTQLFEASTGYQLMVLAAAIDAGAFPPADQRILLISVNAAEPETARRFDQDPLLRTLVGRFDAVHSWNDLIAPLHPKGFWPRSEESPLWERTFRRDMGIPDDHRIELALESIQVPPARTMMGVFSTASATVYAEGLMSYGPTRDPLPSTMWNRIDRVLHLDLVPGLAPLLLSEFGIPAETVPDEAFRAVVDELAALRPVTPRGPYALLLGQYLAPLRLLSGAAEAQLYGDLVESAIAAGFPEVVYKPHPGAPAAYAEALADRAERSGGRLTVERDPSPAEVLYASDPPALVLGCFSTGLITAQRFWGITTACAGTREVLASLPLYEDSNRIPLVLVDLTVPHVARTPGEGGVLHPVPEVDLGQVVQTVGYAMQWRARAAWRATAAAALQDPASPSRAFVPSSRATALLLPGGTLPPVGPRVFHRLAASRDVAARAQELGGLAAKRVRRLVG